MRRAALAALLVGVVFGGGRTGGPAERGVAAIAPGLEQGVVSTPYGGAYEWQYYATGADRVPESVRAAAARITVAVLDTGVDLSAPDLTDKVVGTYDVRTGRRAAGDGDGHGTFVASLVAGTVDDGVGVSGFGGDARLLVIKVSDGGDVSAVDVAAGIGYAVAHGAQIVNLSFAGSTPSPVEQRAVEYAASHGVLVVAAAGNDALAGDPTEYPAAALSDGLGLSVGASDFAGHRAAFSETGPFVSLAAPGACVFGAVAASAPTAHFPRTPLAGPGSYGYASGTSFAAAEVSGAAALVWAADPALSARGVAAVLEQTASGNGTWTPELGYGVIDVAAAVGTAAGRQSR